MTLVVTHSTVTGASADSSAIVDGVDWDANHTLTGTVSVAQGGTGQTSESEAVGELIQALTEDTAPDWSSDYFGVYDASDDTGKKVKLSTISREPLSASRTYYVRTDGSDSNTGLANTAGGAFLTIQKGIDVAFSLDSGVQNVTIQVADGTYAITSQITVEHPLGLNIRIVGNTSTPANCIIRASTQINAIYVGSGCTLGLINGFTLDHDTPASRFETAGILADRGGSVLCGSAMIADGFYWGFFARRGGYIEARSATATSSGDCGFHALDGGVIDATNSTSTGADDNANSLGSGYVAEGGGFIRADGATATGNWLHGFNALTGGHITAVNATGSTSTTGSGFNATSGGNIYAGTASVANGNARYGYESDNDDGVITGTITNPGTANTLGLFKPYVENFYSSQPGSQVVSPNTNESRRYDSKGTGSHFFNVNGSPRLALANTSVQAYVNFVPNTNDLAALGTSSLSWSDLFLASGGVINWNAGDVTVTHSANALAFAGASSGYSFDAKIFPASDDGAPLGDTTHNFSDIFLASGAVVNWNAGDVTLTHSANALAFAGASSGYTFDALISPASSDGAALGSTTLMWSDAFLASGAVINFDNGDVTLTHSANTLAFDGASSGYFFDSKVGVGGPSPIDSVLHIRGTNDNTGGIRIESTAGSAADRLAIFASGNTSTAFQNLSTGNMNWLNSSGNAVHILEGTGAAQFAASTAIPAGGTAGVGVKLSSTTNFGLFFGSGAPTLSAAKGSLYLRSDGSTTNDRCYVNTDGGTTWTAITTAA